jgi:hypothetical protein
MDFRAEASTINSAGVIVMAIRPLFSAAVVGVFSDARLNRVGRPTLRETKDPAIEPEQQEGRRSASHGGLSYPNAHSYLLVCTCCSGDLLVLTSRVGPWTRGYESGAFLMPNPHTCVDVELCDVAESSSFPLLHPPTFTHFLFFRCAELAMC